MKTKLSCNRVPNIVNINYRNQSTLKSFVNVKKKKINNNENIKEKTECQDPTVNTIGSNTTIKQVMTETIGSNNKKELEINIKNLESLLEQSWFEALKDEFVKPYWIEQKEKLQEEYGMLFFLYFNSIYIHIYTYTHRERNNIPRKKRYISNFLRMYIEKCQSSYSRARSIPRTKSSTWNEFFCT